jgi:hypothetical protein
MRPLDPDGRKRLGGRLRFFWGPEPTRRDRVDWFSAPFLPPSPGALFAPRSIALAGPPRGFFNSRFELLGHGSFGMDSRTTALERAFQLAKSGRVSGLSEIFGVLRAEGYSANQIEGPVLKRQLLDLIKVAREKDLHVHRR